MHPLLDRFLLFANPARLYEQVKVIVVVVVDLALIGLGRAAVSHEVMFELVIEHVAAVDFVFRVPARRQKRGSNRIHEADQILSQAAVRVALSPDKRGADHSQVMAQDMHQGTEFVLHRRSLVDLVSRPEHFVISLVNVVKLESRKAVIMHLLMVEIALVQLKLGGFRLQHAFAFEPVDLLEAPHESKKLRLVFVDVDIPTGFKEQRLRVEDGVLAAGRERSGGRARVMQADERKPPVSTPGLLLPLQRSDLSLQHQRLEDGHARL